VTSHFDDVPGRRGLRYTDFSRKNWNERLQDTVENHIREERMGQGHDIAIKNATIAMAERVFALEMMPEAKGGASVEFLSYRDLNLHSPLDLINQLDQMFPSIKQLLLTGKVPAKIGQGLFLPKPQDPEEPPGARLAEDADKGKKLITEGAVVTLHFQMDYSAAKAITNELTANVRRIKGLYITYKIIPQLTKPETHEKQFIGFNLFNDKEKLYAGAEVGIYVRSEVHNRGILRFIVRHIKSVMNDYSSAQEDLATKVKLKKRLRRKVQKFRKQLSDLGLDPDKEIDDELTDTEDTDAARLARQRRESKLDATDLSENVATLNIDESNDHEFSGSNGARLSIDVMIDRLKSMLKAIKPWLSKLRILRVRLDNASVLEEIGVELVRINQDAEFGLEVTDLSNKFEINRKFARELSLNLTRDMKLVELIRELGYRYLKGDTRDLMSPMTPEQKELADQAMDQGVAGYNVAYLELTGQKPRDSFTPISKDEINRAERMAMEFLAEDEMRILRGEHILLQGKLTGEAEHYAIAEQTHRLSLLLLSLLKDRELLRGFAEVWQSNIDHWRTKRVRNNILPRPLMRPLAAFRGSFTGLQNVESQADDPRRLKRFLDKLGIRTRWQHVLLLGHWASDTRLYLPHHEGEPYYYLRPDENYDPKKDTTEGANLHESGAAVPGIADTPFIIYANSVRANHRETLKNYLQTNVPGYENIEFYEFPFAWTTFMVDERTYLLDNWHIDNVVGFIPKRFTERDENILLMDPWYYDEIKRRAKGSSIRFVIF